MKRILCLFSILLFFCASCKKNVDVVFSNEDGSIVYAIDETTNAVKEIEIEYTISDEKELFYLYTIYQNFFPLGYSSPANPNITLKDSYRRGKVVFYEVDNFILLCDISLFQEVLQKTGQCLSITEVHIILNQKQLI